MMFHFFIKACKKYNFDFVLSTCGGLTMTLHPKNTFESINVNQGYYVYNFRKLFKRSIKEMKKYREMRGYH